jgi:predicted phage-related endonuclease
MTAVATKTRRRAPFSKMPEADLALPSTAPEEEWHNVRNQGVGASDVSALLEIEDPDEARGIYKDRYGVWKDKTGRSEPLVYDRDHPIHMGNVQEPTLRKELSERVGARIYTPGLYVSRRNPIMRCTVDGIFKDPDTGEPILAEFKSNAGFGGLTQWADPAKVPTHPLVQVTYSMHLLGIKKAIVFALAGGYFQRRDVEYDPELGEILEDEATTFWNDYVVPDRAPEPTSLSADLLAKDYGIATPEKKVTVDAEMALSLSEEWIRLKKTEDIAKKQRADFKARLKALMQDAEYLCGPDGEVLFTCFQDSTLNQKNLTAARPDMVAKYTRPITSFDLQAFKVEQPEVYQQFRARQIKFKGE